METLESVKTRVYKFGNKTADGNSKMKNLLGGKGANLAEMSLIGIPVPAGFTITTEVCTEYNSFGKDAVVDVIREQVEDHGRFCFVAMGSSRAWCEEEDHGRLHCHEKIKEKIFI